MAKKLSYDEWYDKFEEELAETYAGIIEDITWDEFLDNAYQGYLKSFDED